MQSSIIDSALTAGTVVGAVLSATILVVPFVRYVALVVMTILIAVVYLHGGISELTSSIRGLQSGMASAPGFTGGIISGMLLVLISVGGRRRGRAMD